MVSAFVSIEGVYTTADIFTSGCKYLLIFSWQYLFKWMPHLNNQFGLSSAFDKMVLSS